MKLEILDPPICPHTQTHTHTRLSSQCSRPDGNYTNINHSLHAQSHVSEIFVLLVVNTYVDMCVLVLCICTVN